MSAEREWIADPPPQREHHTPGWLSEKGTGRSHFHSDKYAAKQEEEEDALSAERGWIGDPQPSVEWRDSHFSRQADREAAKGQYHILPADDPVAAQHPARGCRIGVRA